MCVVSGRSFAAKHELFCVMELPTQDLHDGIDARPSLRPLAPVLVFLGGAWLAAAALILIRLV